MVTALKEQNQYVTEKEHLPFNHVSNKSAGENLLGRTVNEVVARWYFFKRVFFKISLNSQENTCVKVGSLFNKVIGLGNSLIHIFFKKHVFQGRLNVS